MFELFFTICIVLMYFLAGVNKMMNFTKTVKSFSEKIRNKISNLPEFSEKFSFKSLPYPIYQFIIAMVVLIEIIAPLIIVIATYSNKYQKLAHYACISLAIFTVLATLLYHFPPNGSHYYHFMKNLTAFGSLMVLSKQF